jgi:hypothetical protein
MPRADGAGGPRRAAFIFIFITVVLDMLSLGMILPVLPKLVESFLGGDTVQAAEIFGVFGTAWALMQFLFSPILGALSDRFGRRPVVLLSNFGLALDYVLMALAPTLTWLFIGLLPLCVIAAVRYVPDGQVLAQRQVDLDPRGADTHVLGPGSSHEPRERVHVRVEERRPYRSRVRDLCAVQRPRRSGAGIAVGDEKRLLLAVRAPDVHAVHYDSRDVAQGRPGVGGPRCGNQVPGSKVGSRVEAGLGPARPRAFDHQPFTGSHVHASRRASVAQVEGVGPGWQVQEQGAPAGQRQLPLDTGRVETNGSCCRGSLGSHGRAYLEGARGLLGAKRARGGDEDREAAGDDEGRRDSSQHARGI